MPHGPTSGIGVRPGIITGWGAALPDKIITNDDLAATIDTSDEWIRQRTGIGERRVGGSTAGLSIEAGRAALDRAGCDPSEIGMLVLCTTTPDHTVPATSARVQHELDLTCGAMDLNAACSGFVYGLVTAQALLHSGVDKILLIGAETLSRITDWEDRSTAVLFGDGAAAVVYEHRGDAPGLLAWDLGSDGSLHNLLCADVGGYLRMEGREVFRQAVQIMIDSADRTLQAAGLRPDQVDVLIPHQANLRIVEAAAARIGVPMENVSMVLERTGNTSAASIPLALVDGIERGLVRDGSTVLLIGFGAGMTWASAVYRWSDPT